MKLSLIEKIKIFNIRIKFYLLEMNKKNKVNKNQIEILKKHYNQRQEFFNILEKDNKYSTEELIKFNIIYDFIYSFNIDVKNFNENINKFEFKEVLNKFNINKEEILNFINIKKEFLEQINKIEEEKEEHNYIFSPLC
jgi:hypothetical protein